MRTWQPRSPKNGVGASISTFMERPDDRGIVFPLRARAQRPKAVQRTAPSPRGGIGGIYRDPPVVLDPDEAPQPPVGHHVVGEERLEVVGGDAHHLVAPDPVALVAGKVLRDVAGGHPPPQV